MNISVILAHPEPGGSTIVFRTGPEKPDFAEKAVPRIEFQLSLKRGWSIVLPSWQGGVISLEENVILLADSFSTLLFPSTVPLCD
jgi:hypothetical protein